MLVLRPPARRCAAALVATIALLASLLAHAAPPSGAAPPAGPPADPPRGGEPNDAGTPRSLTLLTGDVVTVVEAGSGRRAASVTPAPGRESVTFHTREVDGRLEVVPSDTVPYLSAGVLDEDLFDVTGLLDGGYAERDDLPLIVSWAPTTRSASRALAGADRTRLLPSLDGAALAADADRLATLWQDLTPGASALARTPEPGTAPRLGGGVEHVWLDGRVSALLDRSTAQIGAPDAWAAGLTGDGVEVAVLDTGVDADHPDLAGQVSAAKDFTDSESGTDDRHGHGTHVAATVAGSSAAGKYRGVAPEADLLIGKVLGDGGSGSNSQIIAGMEWAAEEGAAVVTMSLGSGPSDGTDPMSLALDRISEEHGTLFVVAAGNDGGQGDVSAPSTAPTALSVAAVDRDESLADFSSRGPRAGDGGLKPEISAPGVGIVAARADDTTMGAPVDDLHTAASGTSMATPHVAGAAVLLAQRHPDWTGQQLKDALVSTARPNPDLGVYEQGAGRVDLTRATAQQVTATGVADFALQSGADDESRRRTVTYRNDGDAPLTLDLELTVRHVDDPELPSPFSAPSRVTVPAAGSATVTIALDALPERGRWSGALVATGPGGLRLQTAVGALGSGPRHTLTITAIGFDGEDAAVPVISILGDQAGSDGWGYLRPGDEGRLVVEEGTYIIQALIAHEDPQDERYGTLIVPDLDMSADRTVVLDARTTRPVQIRTPEVAEQQTQMSWYTHRVFATGRDIQHGVMSFAEAPPWVTPTGPVRAGEFEFSSRWQLVRPSGMLTLPGTDERPRTTLMNRSAELDRPQRLELVAPANGLRDVRGKAVVLDGAGDDVAEDEQVRAAAKAGAAAVILVRPANISIRATFNPNFERLPIPGLLTTVRGGAQLRAFAKRAGRQKVTLEASRHSPYLYEVMQVSPGSVPRTIVHTVTARNSHRITTSYVDAGGDSPWVEEQRFGWRPWMTYAWNDATRLVSTPSRRVEWVSADDSLWHHLVAHDYREWGSPVLERGMSDLVRSYRVGSSQESWWAPLLRPAAAAGTPSVRHGDVLRLVVPEVADADGHVLVGGAASVRARLYRNGVLLSEHPDAVRDLDVPSAAADYRLQLDVAADDAQWARGVRTSTQWSFRSARPKGDASEVLPLLQVGYDVPADSSGRVTRLPHTLGLDVTEQDGSPVRGATLSARYSTDDGTTWRSLAVVRGLTGFVAVVPAGTTPVSLRVTATRGTSTVTQEVIRAYDRRR